MIIIPREGTEKDFDELLRKTESELNAAESQGFKFNHGEDIEPQIEDFLNRTAQKIKSPFQGKITRISTSNYFPDIQVGDKFGVEVKTSNTGWRSTGGSVLESSRKKGIERIYLMFANMRNNPVQFKTGPYENFLVDVAVTHCPRYIIDMDATKSMFDFMGTNYQFVRTHDPIKELLSFKMKEDPNSHAWWRSLTAGAAEGISPATIQMFNELSEAEKRYVTAEVMLVFPQIFSRKPDKFRDVLIYLLREKSIISGNIRDFFSAGGTEVLPNPKTKVSETVSKIIYEAVLLEHEILESLVEIDMDKLTVYSGIQCATKEGYLQEWKKAIQRAVEHNSSLKGGNLLINVVKDWSLSSYF